MTIKKVVCGLGAALALSLVLAPARARAEAPQLTRQRVALLVKDAPASHAVRSELAVAGAAVTASGVLATDNPVLSGLGGARFNPDGSRSFNAVGSLAWPLEVGGKRSARVEAAKAEHLAATARSNGEQRQLLLAALLQHACVLRDERQLLIAAERHALSERVLQAARRRKAAGSVPELDVLLAGLQEKRDSSAEASAAGARDGDRLVLQALLDLPQAVKVAGLLVPAEVVPPLATLLAGTGRQLEVQSASAAVDAASARAARERSARVPTVSVLAQYERDDEANIGMLGLSLPLPILNANRSEVLTSAAEVSAAKAKLVVARAGASGQLKALYARFLATKSALDSLEPAAALAQQAVKLATRGYELGENDLASVLLVRREAVEAEAALLEAQYAHAAIKLELLVSAGRVPQ